MARTDKDVPYHVRKARGEQPDRYAYIGDSGFRKARRWLKRHRSKRNRRAEVPNNKRTWDFE